MILHSKEKQKVKYENTLLTNNLKKLSYDIQEELKKITTDEKKLKNISDKIIYHTLLFTLENRYYADEELYKECKKYFKLNNMELIQKIP